MYILQLMDNYVSSWSVFLMAGLESCIIGWIYGEWTQISLKELFSSALSSFDLERTFAKNLKQFTM